MARPIPRKQPMPWPELRGGSGTSSWRPPWLANRERQFASRRIGWEFDGGARRERPLERVLVPQMGDFVRSLHAEQGVVFHLEDVASAIDGKQVKLKSGAALDADLVVAGIGVRPRTALAEKAGLALDRGVDVDVYLKTSAPGIIAAGDIARWPDPHSGENILVEHWVIAQRQGHTAALNMLGRRVTAVPYFWSQHYDVPINYVGHAESWDELTIDDGAASGIASEAIHRCARQDVLAHAGATGGWLWST